MEKNIIKLTDSYKVTHHLLYPPDTETIYSYFESRGGEFSYSIFYGLQYFLKEYLEGKVINREKINEAKKLFKQHFNGNKELFNLDGWKYILDAHDGKLPISIKAVPEGKKVETSNVLMTIENTDPKCFWLTNYLESLLVQVWYPTTVATISNIMKNEILHFLELTGDPSQIEFKLHDFGFRGVSSVESASVGGSAHLINFKGTDNIISLDFINKYYGADVNYTPGFSIPASEHSTMTAWGRDYEYRAMENMLDQFPKGTIACVSDSFDIYNACSEIWGERLKDKVINRDGTLVIRPDSGYPPDVVCNVLEILGEKFGYSLNEKGYMVLNPKVRVIQGDRVDYKMLQSILGQMTIKNWSADNIYFGMGSGLLQKLNRDTLEFAFKCSAIKRSGKWHDVYKQPSTGPEKNSKKGRMKLVKTKSGYETKRIEDKGEDQLVEVFRDGEILKEYNFEEVIKNSKE
ncbi:MAG: nicotinate phosphoribosyltransferase [Thermodesulfobacteriota bacterium]